MKISRRDLFTFAAGGALGAIFTPAPWRLIGDIATWTQNWSWIPVPPAGEPHTRFTACTLCPAGCAVRVRMVGSYPVSLSGAGPRPAAASQAALCPVGLSGHHLPYHPARVRRGNVEGALSALRGVVAAGGALAILDQRPGRTASLVYRRFLAGLPGGLYLAPAAREDAGLRALGRLAGAGPLAYNLEAARVVIAFGAPLLDGWGTPGRVFAARRNFQLVQVEPNQSRTAAMADLWLPARPATEAAVAQALAGQIPFERAAAITGLSVEQLHATAQLLASGGPALAIGGGNPAAPLTRPEEDAVAALNIALGALGRTIVPRREAPLPEGFDKLAHETALEDVPNERIHALIVDESVAGNPMPWAWLKRKLAPGAVVVSLASSLQGYARHAAWVLPAPVYMESAQDVPPPCDSPAATFSISPALVPAMKGAIEPADFVTQLAGGGPPLADLLKTRVEAIAKSKRGALATFADGKTAPAAEVPDLWKAFSQGALWTDAECVPSRDREGAERPKLVGQAVPPATAIASPPGFPLTLVPSGWRGASGPVSPLFSKLYQESGLRDAPGIVRINPATAREYDLEEGGRVHVETRCGSAPMAAFLDEGVMPGVLAAAVDPGSEVLEICNLEDGRGWRSTPARMRKA